MADKQENQKEEPISFIFGIILILYLLLVVAIAYWIEIWMPKPLYVEDEGEKPDRFIAERASNDLEDLIAIGPRVVGSYQNEVLAVNYFEQIIKDIIAEKSSELDIEYDIHTVSGSYYLAYKPYGCINAYANLQNIAVKVHGSNDTNSILINAHFDTVPRSPGGSDDGINCAVMLEVLRKISRSDDIPTHNVIFLFNGGEESTIQASHGFVTQHEWATDVKVVINLEATGAAGKEILFQAGPEQKWLLDYYSKVPYPFAHVAGEEIFQSNLIPSDSDFRIFRDFGGIIGYDMAYIKDGYRYHTKYDGFDNIEFDRIQRTGDNILTLVSRLMHAPEIGESKYVDGGAVFYDYHGLFLLYYGESMALAINVIVIIFSLALSALSLIDLRPKVSLRLVINLIKPFLEIIISLAFICAVTALVILLVTGMNKVMSWYKIPIWIIGLYSTWSVICSCVSIMINTKYKPTDLTLSEDSILRIHMYRVFWTIFMLVGVIYEIKSVYLLMIPILFNSFAIFVVQIFRYFSKSKGWVLIYLLIQLIPTLFLSAIAYHVFALFIPIAGRYGSGTNTDILIGVLTIILTLFITAFYVPLLTLLSRQIYIVMFLISVFVATIIVIATPVGFPYSGDEGRLTLQRFPLFHTQRIYHNSLGEIIKSDSGFHFRNMDYNSPKSIEKYVPKVQNRTSLDDDCEAVLFCGLPVDNSRDFEELQDATWIPADDNPIFNDVLPEIKLNSIGDISSNSTTNTVRRRYSFTVTGPDCMDIYLSPKDDVEFVSTNLNDVIPDEQPLWKGRPTLYILYTYGKELASLDFYIDLNIPADWDNMPVLDVGITGKYIHEENNILTDEFQDFLDSFPQWTVFTSIFLGYYESREF